MSDRSHAGTLPCEMPGLKLVGSLDTQLELALNDIISHWTPPLYVSAGTFDRAPLSAKLNPGARCQLVGGLSVVEFLR